MRGPRSGAARACGRIAAALLGLLAMLPACRSPRPATATAADVAPPAAAVITFTTEGASFSPIIVVTGAPEIRWSSPAAIGATTSTSRAPTFAFAAAGTHRTTLSVNPWSAVQRINVGYDGADGGSPLLERVPDQQVSAVEGLPLVAPTLGQWCSSYSRLTALDLSGFERLDTVECYRCRALTRVDLSGTPRLARACFERAGLAALDLSQSRALADLRAAANRFPAVTFPASAPQTWHVCTRDNPQLADRALFASTARFPGLAELWIWNDNQAGTLRVPSTHPTRDVSLLIGENQYDTLDLRGALQNPKGTGVVQAGDNVLTRVLLGEAVQLTELDLHGNRLSADSADALLGALDRLGRSARTAPAGAVLSVNLAGNACPGITGRLAAASLRGKGWTVILDARCAATSE